MAKGGARIIFGFMFFVILAGGLAGGGAWYLTEARADGYRATATILLEDGYGPIPLSRAEGLRGDMARALGMPTRPRTAPGLALTPPEFAALFSTAQMAAALKERLEAIYAEAGLEPVARTLESVRKSMDAETRVALQTGDSVAYHRVLELHFTAEDPAIAAAAANAWAEAARDFARDLTHADREVRVASLREALDAHRAELEAAAAQQDELLQSTDLEALAQSAEEQARAARALRETLHELEQTLARDEAALAALKAYVSKAPVAVVLEMSVKEADLEATLAGSRAERDYVAARVADLEPVQQDARVQLAETRRKLEETESAMARLRPEIAGLEEALSGLTESANPVRIAAPAVAPELPAGPHRYVLVGAAAALGALSGALFYLAVLTLRVFARALERP